MVGCSLWVGMALSRPASSAFDRPSGPATARLQQLPQRCSKGCTCRYEHRLLPGLELVVEFVPEVIAALSEPHGHRVLTTYRHITGSSQGMICCKTCTRGDQCSVWASTQPQSYHEPGMRRALLLFGGPSMLPLFCVQGVYHAAGLGGPWYGSDNVIDSVRT